ncbi:MAG: ABC transporter ATP-binding protein [Rhodospirillaceae bacterium]|jgi:ABC-2 type transport system ATP-binding protein
MLHAQNLSKSFGNLEALTNLNLNIAPGEIYILLGANGAGKSTTIRLFLGFFEPTSGAAVVNGRTVSEHPMETKKDLGYIPELVMLYPELTGLENLKYFSKLGGHSYTESELRDILQSAGLQAEAADRRIATYSKGMRQKTGIAVAVAKQAKALLLDEPFSGLDPKASNEFAQILKDMKRRGTAILMATHDIFRAKEVGNRIGIMRAGHLLEEIDPSIVSHTDIENIYVRHMQ